MITNPRICLPSTVHIFLFFSFSFPLFFFFSFHAFVLFLFFSYLSYHTGGFVYWHSTRGVGTLTGIDT
ncbi:hypothetical protein BO86DRAFT_232469 [Aspergillus japonicus CBS 114.51]|uniref:Uncharacterized protein n=1 Tax=Aspergillus japonicus CBS 114.51 TaxID=1448312 RepID=A0A8T8WNZ1_ASPJA|nr:hypothetical protein BO86DRAFT_232469 [Aspergillus japonicus CBS 114.51]RAH77109.1 hypothetical protein BO86DRAFT_232469 [Aspergillus japonicus CBS 114.51]